MSAGRLQADLSEDISAVAEPVPAIMITFTHQLDETRSMCLQTAVGSDCSVDELNERLDRIARASDRQRAMTRLPTVRNFLAIREAQQKKATEELFRVESEKKALYERWTVEDTLAGRRKTVITPQREAETKRFDGEYMKHRGDLASLHNEIEQLRVELDDLNCKAGA